MVYNGVELLVKDGKVAVLVSPGYGAGWSTWNEEAIAYDKRVVEYFDAHPPKLVNDELENAKKFMISIGYKDIYMGGYNNLVKKWVPIGFPFLIKEYDGCEGIFEPEKCIVFK